MNDDRVVAGDYLGKGVMCLVKGACIMTSIFRSKQVEINKDTVESCRVVDSGYNMNTRKKEYSIAVKLKNGKSFIIKPCSKWNFVKKLYCFKASLGALF